MLIALEFIFDVVVPLKDIVISLDLKFLDFLSFESVGIILSFLDPPVNFVLDRLVLLSQFLVLSAFHENPFLEVFQLFQENSLAFLRAAQHVYFQLHRFHSFPLIDLDGDLFTDLFRDLYLALQLLLVLQKDVV